MTLTRSLVSLFLVLSLAFQATAAPKTRAAAKPSIDFSTPEGWLIRNAHVLSSAERVPFLWDFEPLRNMIGDATIVGLGDGTHGTHEFYTIKIRAIEYLVREMNFDVVAFEAPFPLFNRLNEYVQGGPGDPAALLHEASDRLSYLFWETQEILALVEWMREYNAHRGERPPIQLAGADIYDQVHAWKNAVAYLRTVDPALAATAETEFACVGEKEYTTVCSEETRRVIDAMTAREAELIARSSAAAFHDALQSARVVLQTQSAFISRARDASMAANMLWMREHRGTSGRVIYWAHNEHVTTGPSELGHNTFPAGDVLEQAIGDRYFAIATMTAAGTYMQWEQKGGGPFLPVVKTLPALPEGAYETFFRQRRMPYLLIPLRGTLPDWLTGPARWNSAGVSFDPQKEPASLPEKFDAAIFVDTTTAAHLLP